MTYGTHDNNRYKGNNYSVLLLNKVLQNVTHKESCGLEAKDADAENPDAEDWDAKDVDADNSHTKECEAKKIGADTIQRQKLPVQ